MDQTPADGETRRATTRAITCEGQSSPRLVPDLPPGRCTRKALPFADEIRRLYETGYTLEAIRRALAAAGVSVSRSTVHREVNRTTRHPQASSSAATSRNLDQTSQAVTVEAETRPKGSEAQASADPLHSLGKPVQANFADGPRGEDVAKAFMATQVTNPFMRKKEHQ
jgi:hypothetical protein